MTDFALSPSQAYAFENLDWDLTPQHGGFVISGTLDVAALTEAQHFADGYIKSGLVLARRTSDSLLVPYLEASVTAGVNQAVGVLRASVAVTRLIGGGNRTKIGVACLVHGVVDESKLPFTVGNAAAGGYLDAAAKADLPLIYWA
jgi:heptaprenylglyceryl phosphate synthase